MAAVPSKILLVTIALSATALAGCLGSGSDVKTNHDLVLPVFPDLSDLIDADHDHTDRALHDMTWNVGALGWSSGFDGEPPAGASYNELAVKCGFVFLGRSLGGGGGFSIIDVMDPANPVVVGEWKGESTFDVEIDDECDYAYVATQRNCAPGTGGEAQAHVPRGLHVVDIRDKTKPAWNSYFAMPPNGVHTNVYFKMEDGTELMILQSYDLTSSVTGCVPAGSPLPFGALPVTQRILVNEITEVGGKKLLEHRALIQLPARELPGSAKTIFPHDSFVQEHPLTGRLLLYVPYWDAGLHIWDISDPANPQHVAEFSDTGPSKIVSLHYAEAFGELIDGKHITVIAPEIPSGDEQGQFTILDTSDPTNPVKLGFWTLPGGPFPVAGFNFSPHNFDLKNGHVYLAYNHGGVWALDVSNATLLANPQPLGYWFDASQQAEKTVQAPTIWGVEWKDGVVFASDTGTGLYVLHMKGDELPAMPVEMASHDQH